jgi:hypothetical protein
MDYRETPLVRKNLNRHDFQDNPDANPLYRQYATYNKNETA